MVWQCQLGHACAENGIGIARTNIAMRGERVKDSNQHSHKTNNRGRNRQELWVGFVDHAATLFGFSMSTPFLKVAPARTSAARCGPFMARQRSCAAMMSL